MKNEMITYRPDDSEQILVEASEKALDGLGIFGGNSKVNTSYELLTALSDAVKRSNLILVLITKNEYIKIKKIVSKSLGIELVRNASVSKKLGRLAEDKQFQLHDNFPKGSVVLDSKDSLYSGFYLKSGNQCIVFSPLDTVRTEGILEKAGIKLNIECVAKHKLRFVGVSKAQVENTVREVGGVKSFEINDLRGELELTVETVGTSDEIAQEQSKIVISAIKKIYRSRLYGVDSPVLASLVVSVLENERNQLAIADTENSSSVVGYLAGDRRAGEWCKKIRLSSSCSQACTQDEVSALVRKVRDKSGFELAVALGDECLDEEKSREYIYGALANEQGVLTKRFWKQNGESAADFRTRCAKELVLLLYNDRIGDEEYNNVKKNARRVGQTRKEKKPEPVTVSPPPVTEQDSPEVLERKNRIAPKEDKSVTKTKVIIMLVLVIVVIIVAIFVSRGTGETDTTVNSGGGNKPSATTTTTAPTTTTLPKCDMCGKDIEGEVNVYVDENGEEKHLCKQDYDFIVGIGG